MEKYRIIPFDRLRNADLIVDAVYEGGLSGNTSDEPLPKLMYCGNQGGFRKVGRAKPKYVILYSTLSDRDWPDTIDIYNGSFTYYGDNKTPGSLLHETKQGGNKWLKDIFSWLHDSPSTMRDRIPPIFIFTKFPTKSGRSVQFRGIAVPGAKGISFTDDLVAIWKATEGKRFQNYRALFTILDIPVITRAWIDERYFGSTSENAPLIWNEWVKGGPYKPLISPSTIHYRTIDEQTPSTELERQVVQIMFEYFKDFPTLFEHCASTLINMLDPNYIVDQITRPVVDGGRDAIGRYKLGPLGDSIFIDFALEAKCYDPGLSGNPAITVGVHDTSRLISRLRHRQFGILVTTSVISRQTYKEIREDGHPIILMCGRDIAQLLLNKGLSTREAVKEWLQREFPISR